MISNPLIFSSIDYVPDTSTADEIDQIRKFQQLLSSGVLYFPALGSPRAGMAPNPWNFKLLDQHKIPEMPDKFSLGFSDITDHRAQEIAKICQDKNLPVAVQWSGGIDSTLILAAIVKNFPKYLLPRVHVYMNNASYLENPMFFNRVIKPNKLSYGNEKVNWDKFLLISGYPADPLWGYADLVEFERHYPGEWKNNPVSNPDRLIYWIEQKTTSELAHWFFEIIAHSSQTSGIDINDYGDFFWWGNFNFNYSAQCMHAYASLPEAVTPESYSKYRENVIAWYHDRDYQIWSMVNRGNGVKFDGTIRNYKKPAKDYIFDVDHNPYYRDYKTKMGSDKKGKRISDSLMVALYEDGTAVYKDIKY